MDAKDIKEYKGYGGGKITVDGDNLHIKGMFIKDNFTFDDITMIKWTEPAALTNGKLEIYTHKQNIIPHTLVFLKKQRDTIIELRELIAQKIDGKVLLPDQNSQNAPGEQDSVQDQRSMKFCSECGAKVEGMKFCGECGNSLQSTRSVQQPIQQVCDNVARCPNCGSTSLSGNKKGFGVGKAAVGFALTGGIGLMAGNIGAKKVRVTCLKCGKQFCPGS